MNLRRTLTIAGLGLTVALGSTQALTVDDGTGGPDQATPNAAACDREPASVETIANFVSATPGVFMGEIESVDSASLSQYAPITGAVADEITATLVSYSGCVQKNGPAGAYAFLAPGLADVELIYLGVFDTSAERAPAVVASPEGFSPTTHVADFTPKLIVQLPDDRVGAVVAAPQPGTDLALLTLINQDGEWFIEHVAPVVDGGSNGDGSSGGGP
jgi:hypothetical protein